MIAQTMNHKEDAAGETMKDAIALTCFAVGAAFLFLLKGQWEEARFKDYTIQQQAQTIQQLEAEKRGMERALGLSR